MTLEAMASGLPVVAYDLAAASQYVRSGEDGFLAETDDGPGFTQALSLLLSHDWRTAGRAARQRAESASWASVGIQFDQHVGRALKARRETISVEIQTMV